MNYMFVVLQAHQLLYFVTLSFITQKDSHYKMTETRGRALILSNRHDTVNSRGEPTWRRGAEHDHSNMKQMWERFGFVTSGAYHNYTAKVI